jgi:glutaredoxin
MKKIHVEGKKSGDIILYALSTCVWCGKTKKLLNELGVAYSYVDVDLLDENEKMETEAEIKRWNPDCSFPTLVKDGKFCIVGYRPDEIKEKIKK